MNFLEEYRTTEAIKTLETLTKKAVERLGKGVRIMEFCGGHTHSILKHGIDQLLQGYVKFVHGPGCPVCVLPSGRVELALEMAGLENTILCTYGDVLRVPGSSKKSLIDLRAEGKDVRMLYSCLDAIRVASENPDKQVLFFAIGFETTTPQTAVLVKRIKQLGLKNLSVVSNHVLTPAAIRHLFKERQEKMSSGSDIDAIIGPGHVSAIIGTEPYQDLAKMYHLPIVISGFEPLDLMQSVYMAVRQIMEGRAEVENQYRRAVNSHGNLKARRLMAEVFEVREDFEWRGLGKVPHSALRLNKEYEEFDAEKRFRIDLPESREHPACLCGSVIRGVAEPFDCKLFGSLCTPKNPIGSCMVSSEGACNAYYRYRWGSKSEGTALHSRR